MKMMTLSMLILAGSSNAFAQEAVDEQWVKLRVLVIEGSASPALQDTMARADAAIKQELGKGIKEVCDNRARYDFDPEAFAKVIEGLLVKERALKAEAIAEADGVLRENEKARLRELPNAMVYKTNIVENLRNGTIDLKTALDRTCQTEGAS